MRKKTEIEDYIINGGIDIDKLLDDYTPYLKTVIQNMIGDNLSIEDKEEILLDTFFILWKRYVEDYQIESLSSYLAGITKNLIKEKLKKRQIAFNIDDYTNLIDSSHLNMYSQEREEFDYLYDIIRNLKDIDISIITMFYYDNTSIKDIAKELNISEINVKTRLYRLRKKIKQKLKTRRFLDNE